MNDGVTITCGCGHEAALGEFTRTVCGELAAGHFQCPACTIVHRFTFQGQAEVRLITKPNKLVPDNPSL